MKKVLTIIVSLAIFGFPVVSHAQTSTAVPTVSSAISNLRQDIKNDKQKLAQEKKELREDVKANRPARLNNAVVASKSAQSFTVTKDGKTYTINVSSNTKFRRHFWGESSFSELSVNDVVNIWGKWTDSTQTAIDARLVRNLSVQKFRGVFFGTVKSKGSNSFVMTSRYRGDQTVNFDSSTKFVNRKEQAMNFSDIQVGDKVRVKGVWDKKNGTVSKVAQVKDFSIPKITAPTTTP